MFLTPKRSQHFAAMILIGDGVMALIHPSKDAEAWSKGPRPWRSLMQALARNPSLTRGIGVAQIAAGVIWALHQAKDAPRTSLRTP